MSKLLFIVDVQNDFVSGSLAVPDARGAIDAIEKLIADGGYDYIWASKDWHPENHLSFSPNPQFKDKSWPTHCVSHTWGADFASEKIAFAAQKTFYKGTDPRVEAYSAFDGQTAFGVPLAHHLERKVEELTRLDIVGLATDYCVKATAIDAARKGFFPTVLLAATRPVTATTGMLATADMALEGVYFE